MIDFEKFSSEAEAVRAIKAVFPEMTTPEARQYLRRHLPKESYYQTKVMQAIREAAPEAFVWKAAAGPYSRQGIPDVCAVINGRFYGFEIKRPLVGVLSAIQRETIRQIKRAGGRACVVTGAAQIREILEGK